MADPNDVARSGQYGVGTLLKAVILGARPPDPASTPGGEGIGALFGAAGALDPPYDPEALCLLFEHSNSLRQNVDAYATNIDGFGHRLEPAIDFDADEADRRVGECIYIERLAARDRGDLPADSVLEATPEEIQARRRELVQLARGERARLAAFFEACSFDHSFVELRRRTRQDVEVTGNAYWEVLLATSCRRVAALPAKKDEEKLLDYHASLNTTRIYTGKDRSQVAKTLDTIAQRIAPDDSAAWTPTDDLLGWLEAL